MPSYLADILATHRADARGDRRDADELAAQATQPERAHPPPRDFAGGLRGERALVHRRDQAPLAVQG